MSQGFFTFDDLSVIEPDQLAEIGGLSEEDCDKIVSYADRESQRLEAEEKIAADLRKQAAAQGGIPRAKVVQPCSGDCSAPETVVVEDSSAPVEEA